MLVTCTLIIGIAAASNQHSASKIFINTIAKIAVAEKSALHSLTIEERVICQESIEKVYWKHRIWPRDNPQPKPPFESVTNRETVRMKVEDMIRKSAALDYYWHRPITGEQIQAEMERMARQTRQPEVLRELWNGLNNDPALIAECLARPALIDRLIRNWYANDERFHNKNQKQASINLQYQHAISFEQWWEGAKSHFNIYPIVIAYDYKLPSIAVQGCEKDTWRQTRLSPDPRHLHAAVWTGAEMIIWGGNLTNGNTNTGGKYNPATDTWVPTSTASAPTARIYQTAVWSGTEMIIWGGDYGLSNISQGSNVWVLKVQPSYYNTGGRYNPVSDSWVPTSITNAPGARREHTAVWTGTEMIIWGGRNTECLYDGGRYNPATDSWVPTSTASAPNLRRGHTAVWTGTEMIIWGGINFGYLYDGGRYNPASNTWAPAGSYNFPEERAKHIAVWTGTEMIVWGGQNSTGYLNTGGRYNPVTNSWSTISSNSSPSPRTEATAVWTGTEMIVWGGCAINNCPTNTGGRYDPGTDSWIAASITNAPVSRNEHTAVWTGTEMIVWGGLPLASALSNGGRYDPVTDSWIPTSITDAPSKRTSHTAIWTGIEMIVWGGWDGNYNNSFSTGARYRPSTDSWTPTAITNAPTGRFDHKAIWTGTEMVIWGGWGSDSSLNTGGRYNPVSDSWTATSSANAPSGRYYHTAVWTGSDMIIWGGYNINGICNTGGRYNPASDIWQPTTVLNAPTPRAEHSAIWTGTAMIIWGGYDYDYLNTGGRYDPVNNTWTAISKNHAPSPRAGHIAVWIGSEMIVWGGYDYYTTYYRDCLNTGAKYKAITNSWSPIATENAPAPRSTPTAVWTGNEIIVWGGQGIYQGGLDSGGRYFPWSDLWITTSGVNAPLGRNNHTAVWTGEEMIIWGGDTGSNDYNPVEYYNSGGRYCTVSPVLVSKKPAIDDSAGNTPNGMIEPDEPVNLIGSLYNTSAGTATAVSGILSTTDPIVITHAGALYPDINSHTGQNCTTCYSMNAPAANRPATHWDITVTESPACSGCDPASYSFTYHIGNSFRDVPPKNLFYSYIEKLLHSGIVSGCTANTYCPNAPVSRQQMAKFICLTMKTITPITCVKTYCQNYFDDVPDTNLFCPYIEELADNEIVSGCQSSPSLFCPNENVQRQAMAKFICNAMDTLVAGSCYPLSCNGIFTDVPSSNVFCAYIEALYSKGIISGCGSSLYCPNASITREQLSKFLVNAFEF